MYLAPRLRMSATGLVQGKPGVMPDPYDLQRFVDAQDRGSTYDSAVEELRRGRKTTHWMWFVFLR